MLLEAYGELTIVQVDDGETGASPFFVSVQNENQNIPCDSTGKTSTNFIIDIPFSAYEGINMVPASVQVTGLPSGVTLGDITSSTSNIDGSIKLNVAKGNLLDGNMTGTVKLSFTVTGSTTQTVTRKFTWSKTFDGADGKNPTFYTVVPSVGVIKRASMETTYIEDELGNILLDESGQMLYDCSFMSSDELTPSSITFSAYSQEANKDRQAYACRFIIQESENGISYSSKYTSSKDETSVTYTPSSSAIQYIKCIMCKSGGITQQIEFQTVPIIHDAKSYDSAIKALYNRISCVGVAVDQAEKNILLKATQQDIDRTISNYDSTEVQNIRDKQAQIYLDAEKIRNRVSSVEEEIVKKADGDVVTKLTDRVTEVEQTSSKWQATAQENFEKIGELKVRADKVEQRVSDNEGNIASLTTKTDEISSTVSGMTVGGTNLIRNSNDLIFALYYFVADIIDENGNTLIDETGNTLVAYY